MGFNLGQAYGPAPTYDYKAGFLGLRSCIGQARGPAPTYRNEDWFLI